MDSIQATTDPNSTSRNSIKDNHHIKNDSETDTETVVSPNFSDMINPLPYLQSKGYSPLDVAAIFGLAFAGKFGLYMVCVGLCKKIDIGRRMVNMIGGRNSNLQGNFESVNLKGSSAGPVLACNSEMASGLQGSTSVGHSTSFLNHFKMTRSNLLSKLCFLEGAAVFKIVWPFYFPLHWYLVLKMYQPGMMSVSENSYQYSNDNTIDEGISFFCEDVSDEESLDSGADIL